MRTGHVGLNVPDVARALPFSTGVFGWNVLGESDRPGLHHLAFDAASIDEVEAAEARVRDLGGTVHHGGIVPHSEGSGSGGIFFTDPDRIRLEIYAGDGAQAHGAAPAGAAPTCGFF
jgi:lactoylglutathione lyase